MKAKYVCQLSKQEQLKIYKAVKSVLVEEGNYSVEAILDALNSRVSDLSDIIGKI